LAGKKAIFDVEVLEASKRVVPEVTDEFAAKVKDGLTAESLLAELQKAVDQEDAKEFAPARNKALGNALAEVMNVDVPDTLVTNQSREKFAVMMAEMRDGGVSDDEIKKQINPENFLKYKNIVKDDIIRDFKISMATDEIARLEGINVPDYQIEEQVEAIKKDAAGSEDFDENMVRAKVQTALQRQAVMDWLAERSNLEVEYKEEEQFDEALMEKLAEESVKREEELMKKSTEATPAAAAAPSPVPVETEPPKQTPAAAKVDDDDDDNLSLEEKAFRALLNTGAVELHKSPDDPDYDHSKDDEIAAENRIN
jgi:trigger factor